MQALARTSTPRGRAIRAEILLAIDAYRQRHHAPPTVRDVATLVQLETSTVHFHLQVLREQGKVAWMETLVRTLHVCRLVSSFTRG